MAKKSVLFGSMAFLASTGLLAIGCSDKNQYGSKDAAKNSLSQDQMQATPGASGIGEYPDTQGSATQSGTGYYDESRSGKGGSYLDTATGMKMDTSTDGRLDTATGRKRDSLWINSRPDTSTPGTGPGTPGRSGGSGRGGAGTDESGSGGAGTGGTGTGGSGSGGAGTGGAGGGL